MHLFMKKSYVFIFSFIVYTCVCMCQSCFATFINKYMLGMWHVDLHIIY